MNEFALIETFCGDKLFSERKYPLNEYYDGDCIELDNANFIIGNGISKMIITIPYFDQKSYCFFNVNGFGYKYVDIKGDNIEKVEFIYKDDIIKNLEVSFSVDNSICAKLYCRINDNLCTELYCRIKDSEKQPKIKGGVINGSEMRVLFEYESDNMISEKTYDFSKDYFALDSDRFFISISDNTNEKILK